MSNWIISFCSISKASCTHKSKICIEYEENLFLKLRDGLQTHLRGSILALLALLASFMAASLD